MTEIVHEHTIRSAREQYESLFIKYVRGGATRAELESLQITLHPFLDPPYNNVFEIEGVILMAALLAGQPGDSPVARAAQEWIDDLKKEQIGG